MQIEKIWSGLPAPKTITNKVRRVKDTYTDDAVTFEKEKREEKKAATPEQEETEQESSKEDPTKEKEASEPKAHIDVTV